MVPVGIHLTIFYTDTVLVPIGFIALVGAAARSIDALTDPLMGWLSDHTRTRWGRRRPWIAVGAPLCAVAYAALFAPPEALGPASAAVWFAVSFVAYYLFRTIYSIAAQGLGAELSLDYRERNRLFVLTQGFGFVGTLFAPVLPLLMIRAYGIRSGYALFAALVAGLFAALYLHLVWRVRERPEFMRPVATPLVPGLRRAWQNRPFRILVLAQLASSPYQAFLPLLPYLTKYVLRPEAPDFWLMTYLLLYFGSALVAMPLWLWAANRFGKKRTWLSHFGVVALPTLGLFFIGEGDTTLTAVLLALAGAGFGGGPFVLLSMTADVIDYDQLLTGKRREAQYAGLRAVIMKFVDIGSITLPLAVFGSLGFVPNAQQSPTLDFAIRALAGLVPAVSVVLGFAVACLYPITRRVHQEIQQGIRRHAAGQDAVDPLSGETLPPAGEASADLDEETSWFLDHFSAAELKLSLKAGPAAVLGRTLRAAAACLVFAVAMLVVAVSSIEGFGTEPGILAVSCVFLAGLGLTATCFNALRVRAALRWRSRPLSMSAVRAHLGQD